MNIADFFGLLEVPYSSTDSKGFKMSVETFLVTILR